MGVCHCINESPQCHFDILQQLKSATVHTAKPALGKRRLYLVGGGANSWKDGKVAAI